MRSKICYFSAIAFSLFVLLFSAGPAFPQTNLFPPPYGQNVFTCPPSASAICHIDPSLANPLGLGPIATGGDFLTLQVAFSGFAEPVDIYIALYVPEIDGSNVYLLGSDMSFQPLSAGFLPWRQNTTVAVDQTIFRDIPKSSLPAGTYTFGVAISPSGQGLSNFDLWISQCTVESPISSPPSAPTGVRLDYQFSIALMAISWNAVPGASQYVIYWGTSYLGEPRPVITTSSNSLPPTAETYYRYFPTGGYCYSYRVAAENAYGQSLLSLQVNTCQPMY